MSGFLGEVDVLVAVSVVVEYGDAGAVVDYAVGGAHGVSGDVGEDWDRAVLGFGGGGRVGFGGAGDKRDEQGYDERQGRRSRSGV